MSNIAAQIEQAQRKVDAIDKRIDAVRAELLRGQPEFDQMCAFSWQRAWDSRPGLQGIEKSLYLRRADAAGVRDGLVWKQERADELRANREFRKQARAQFEASRCATCGQSTYGLAA